MEEQNEIIKNEPFRVPDGYFESLSNRIIAATKGIEPEEEKRGLVRGLKPYLAVAATVAVLFILGYLYFQSSQERKIDQKEVSFNELNINYINDIDLLVLEERVADYGSFDRVPMVNSNEIIDYLITENIDILDIYEQL